MEWTNELIEEGKSKFGDFSLSQFALMGIKWPPKKGWKRAVIGRITDQATVKTFLTLKGTGGRKRDLKNLEREKAIAEAVREQQREMRQDKWD